jgi:hypothetical protein
MLGEVSTYPELRLYDVSTNAISPQAGGGLTDIIIVFPPCIFKIGEQIVLSKSIRLSVLSRFYFCRRYGILSTATWLQYIAVP